MDDQVANDDKGPNVLTCEVEDTILKMSKQKAMGQNEISADFIQYMQEDLKEKRRLL